jgi:hypothetical protein
MMMSMLLFIVINYINLFVFDDEIEMKNRSSIQTLTFIQTNPDHLYMKLNMPGTCNHSVLVLVHVQCADKTSKGL